MDITIICDGGQINFVCFIILNTFFFDFDHDTRYYVITIILR